MSVWVDVTDLMAWRGHLTGIQRVVFNIASRLQRDDKTVRFFYYEPHSGKFYEKPLDFNDWLKSNTSHVDSAALSVRNKMLNMVPHRLRRVVPRNIKHLAVKTAKYALHKKRSLSVKIEKNTKVQDNLVEFKKNDLVLILGNGWDNQKIFTDMGDLKNSIGFKLVNVVYDVIPILEPQFFGGMVTKQYTDYLFEAVTNCDLLLPISKSTENDVLEFCKSIEAPLPKTAVIRLGDEIAGEEHPTKPRWVTEKNFILCVGTIEVRKNHALLYYAYKKLINEGVKPPKFLIVGKRGWYTGDVLMLFDHDIKMKPYVQVIDNATDDELSWLYQNCMFTVYPSMYEGWGLPVAESLARGKVVLSSDSSSIPEAGGELADYFSPYDPVTCAELIKKYSNADNLRQKEKEIQSRYNITTWEECYKQVRKYLSL